MIKLISLIESLDTVHDDGKWIVNYNNLAAMVFGYFQNKMKLSYPQGIHFSLVSGKERDDFKYAGRIFPIHKIIHI